MDGRSGEAAVERGFDLAVSRSGASRDHVLRLIALFKFAKAGVAALVAFGAFRLVHSEVADRLRAWALPLASASEPSLLRDLLGRLVRAGPDQVRILRGGALFAFLLFVVEGVGLWRDRPWAQYLTVAATMSFVPFEIYELAKRFGLPALTALVVNLIVVAYLVHRLAGRDPT